MTNICKSYKLRGVLMAEVLYRRQNWFLHVILKRNWQRPDKQLFCNCLYRKTSACRNAKTPGSFRLVLILFMIYNCSTFSPPFCSQNSWMFYSSHQVTPWTHFLPFQAPAGTLEWWHMRFQSKSWLPPPFRTGEHVRQLSWLSAPETDLQNSSTFVNWSPLTATQPCYTSIYWLTAQFFRM